MYIHNSRTCSFCSYEYASQSIQMKIRKEILYLVFRPGVFPAHSRMNNVQNKNWFDTRVRRSKSNQYMYDFVNVSIVHVRPTCFYLLRLGDFFGYFINTSALQLPEVLNVLKNNNFAIEWFAWVVRKRRAGACVCASVLENDGKIVSQRFQYDNCI